MFDVTDEDAAGEKLFGLVNNAGVAVAGDHGHRRPRQRHRIAANRNEWRRVVDHLQPRRMVRLAQGYECDAELVRRGDLAQRIRKTAACRLRRHAAPARATP